MTHDELEDQRAGLSKAACIGVYRRVDVGKRKGEPRQGGRQHERRDIRENISYNAINGKDFRIFMI